MCYRKHVAKGFVQNILHHQRKQRTIYITAVKYRIIGSKLDKNKILKLVLFFDDAWFR